MLQWAVFALAALAPNPTPTPSTTPSPLPIISSVRIATGSSETLHALPVAASVIDSVSIASSSAYATDALLRSLPGFDRTRSNSLFTNYGQLRVSFAGAGSDRGLVLADGVPAQDAFGGQIDWAAYPASDIERAELLLGAGSALYGAGAVGGVLDIETYSPPADRTLPAGNVSLAAGSRAFSQQWANARVTIAPRLNASFALQQQRLEYSALAPGYQSAIDRVSQADASMAAFRLRYAATSRDTIELGERGAWDDQFEGRTNYAFSRRLVQTDARFTHATPRSTLQTTLYSRSAFIVNAADQYPTAPGALRYVQDVPTNESGAALRWIFGAGPSTFELTADARHAGGESAQYGTAAALQNSGAGLQSLGGVAAQWTRRMRRFELVAGARFDEVRSYGEQLATASRGVTTVTAPPDRLDEAISPRIAARYDVSPHLALRASWGSGLRAPFLNELVRGYFIGSVAFEPNPALVPERSRTLSGGIDFLGTVSHLSLDAFDTSVNDAIMFRTIDATHQMRSNVAATRTESYLLRYTRALGGCSRISAVVRQSRCTRRRRSAGNRR